MENGNGRRRVLLHVGPDEGVLFALRVAEDGVDQTCRGGPERGGDPDGFMDDGEGWNPVREPELIEGRAEDVPHRRLQRGRVSPVELCDDPVQEAPHPERAVDQFGQEPPILRVECRFCRKRAVQERLCIGAFRIDPGENFDGHLPGRMLHHVPF